MNDNLLNKIDTIFKNSIVVGSYEGDKSKTRQITLSFQPDIVLLFAEDGRCGYNLGGGSTNITMGGLFTKTMPLYSSLYARYKSAYINNNGFVVSEYSNSSEDVYSATNSKSESDNHRFTYYYCAL